MNARRDLLTAMGGLAACMLAHSALPEVWPARPVRIVVPYPPGGANDITARVYAQHLQQALGQPVVIDNKAGAGGEIGAETVAKSPADGYTLLFGAIGSLAVHAVVPSQRPAYELSKAFIGVSMGSSVPLAVAVRADLPAQSVQSLLAMAKAKPETLTYGSAGIGSTQHMTMEYFMQRTGVRFVHVPYKGSAPAVSDLMGGQIDIVMETLPALSAQLNTGKIRVLGVTSMTRTSLLPKTPTLDEEQVRGFEVSTMYGLLAPKGTPKEIVEKLSTLMQSISHMPVVKEALSKQGAEAMASSPQETDALIRREVDKWAQVAKAAKLD